MRPTDFPEVWDSSMVSDLKSCQMKCKLAHIDWWKGRGENVHLHAGHAFAVGIEAARRAFYIDGLSAPDAGALGIQKLLQDYGSYDPGDSPKTAERMAGALEYYLDNYPLNHDTAYPVLLPGQKRGIEFNFVLPLPLNHPTTNHPLLYAGRLDAILAYGGSQFGFDEKTTTQLGSSWGRKWSLRGQFLGYTWGCRESGVPVQGIVVRGISILKTKYETQESINYYPDWMLDQWYIELLQRLQGAINAWKSNTWLHDFDNSCTDFGGCQFIDVCRSVHKDAVLSTGFEQRHWDPVTREEIKA